MGFLKFLVWTSCAVGFGIFLARGEIDGRTPLEHLDRLYQRTVQTSAIEDLKGDIRDALEGASGRLAGESKAESYSDDERRAVERLIAKSQTK